MNMWNKCLPCCLEGNVTCAATVYDFMCDPMLEKYDTQVIAFGTSNRRQFLYNNTVQLN